MSEDPRARETSVEVYDTIKEKGLLSKRRWEAYRILWHHGPLTSNEIFQKAKLHGNPDYRHNTNARMTELRTLGVVKEIGTKKCSVTGHEVILWDVTKRLPIDRKSIPKKVSKTAALKELIEEACRELELSGDLFAHNKAQSIRARAQELG